MRLISTRRSEEAPTGSSYNAFLPFPKRRVSVRRVLVRLLPTVVMAIAIVVVIEVWLKMAHVMNGVISATQ